MERAQPAGTQRGTADEPARLEVPGARARMILRPLATGDETELRRIHETPEVVRWWDLPDEGFPWTDEPEATRLTIEVDGAVAGLIQFSEELEPRYRHAGIDIFLDPALHGRGLGTEALRRVVRHLIDDRGHHASRSTPRRRTRRPSGRTRRSVSGPWASCGGTSATLTETAGTTAC